MILINCLINCEMGLMVSMHSVLAVFIVSMNISLYHGFNDLSNRLITVSLIYLTG